MGDCAATLTRVVELSDENDLVSFRAAADGQFTAVDTKGDRATLMVESDTDPERVGLQRIDGEWKISGLVD